MADTGTPSFATSGMPSDAPVADGPPPSRELLARYPSLSPDGEFGQLRRVPRHAPPTPPDPSDPRVQAHLAAVADQRREGLRLRNRYPSLDTRTQFEPVAPDPADLRRYRASMPAGGVDLPAPAAQPGPAPAQQPAAPAPEPNAPAAALPEAYQNLQTPEAFELDQAAFAPIAQELAQAGYSKAQVEKALELHARLEAQTDEHLEATARAWRAESERLPATEIAAAKAAFADAPDEVKRTFEVSRLGNHAPTLRWLAKLRRGGR